MQELALARWRRTKCFRNTEFNGYNMQLSGPAPVGLRAERHDVNRSAARRPLLGGFPRDTVPHSPSEWAFYVGRRPEASRPRAVQEEAGPGPCPEEGRRCLGVKTPSPRPCARVGAVLAGPGSASSLGPPHTLLFFLPFPLRSQERDKCKSRATTDSFPSSAAQVGKSPQTTVLEATHWPVAGRSALPRSE